MTQRLFKIAALAAAGVLAVKQFLLSPRGPRDESGIAEKPVRQNKRAGLKRWILRIVALVGALGIVGFLVAASGIIPIKASSGHWAITRWFLKFSMERSVATNTIGLETPQLDEPGLVLKGAGHYEIGCSPCHGSPALRTPRIPQHMTPQPPYLSAEISEWEPEELFYIVKHGIKFTGMPAWPAEQRDDEVWAVVAFLRKLPELDAGQYRRLISGEDSASGEIAPLSDGVGSLETIRTLIGSCARCHGADGRGSGSGAFPKLTGQRPDYLFASMQSFARGERHSGIMEPIAAELSSEVMRELADYYARQPESAPFPLPPDAAQAIERGKEIAIHGIPSQRVPSCVDCHGPSAIPRNPAYPLLAGQYADYILLQLELFKKEHRGGTAYAHLMRPVAAHLTPEQMRDVALYYASLSAASSLPAR